MTTRISTLPSLATVTAATILPVVESGATKRVTAAALATYITGTVVASSVPGGSSGHVQYNTGSAFGGSSNLYWDNSNTRLGVGTASPANTLSVAGAAASTSFLGALIGNTSGGTGSSAQLMLSGLNNNTRGVVIEGLITSAGSNTHDMVFYTNASSSAPTESMRITSGATVILKGGSTSTTGVGIAFPATQSASNDANTLDDYEEGTFTPTLSFDNVTTGITYNVQKGRYTKVGRLVTVFFAIGLTSKGSATGAARISLPFASDEYGQPNLPGYTGFLGYTNLGTVGFIVGNSGAAGLPFSTSTNAYLTNSNFANDSFLVMTTSYNV